MRWGRFIGLVLSLLLPLSSASAQSGERCFPETGYCISGPIRSYWERNGGLPVFGFPKGPQTTESVEGVLLTIQWFERDRLEIQPNGLVTAGRLGAQVLEMQGTPWQFGTVGAAGSGCIAFRETGHQVCGAFRQYWQRSGGLERFGFPITDEFTAVLDGKTMNIQWFERRRFEWHADINNGTVLLGLLGNEVLAARSAGTPAPANRLNRHRHMLPGRSAQMHRAVPQLQASAAWRFRPVPWRMRRFGSPISISSLNG